MRIVFIFSSVLAGIISVIILYQLYHVYIGGTWSTENIILAMVTANLSATIALYGLVYGINGRLERHIGEHR